VADRFYCPVAPVDGRAILEGDEARHLARVRRVALGEVVELFDGGGGGGGGGGAAPPRDRVELTVVGPPTPGRRPALDLTLATAVPKGERFDWLVEKATELGVTRLIPMVTERSVVDPRSAKLDRLRRTVIEASKQSRRDRLMDLDEPTPWATLAGASRADLRLIAQPGGVPIGRSGPVRRGGSAMIAIGPEGGFTPAEVDRAGQSGWRPVGLGPTTLRVETAGLAAVATLMALAGADGDGDGDGNGEDS